MNNKFSKIVLILILVFQLTIPVAFLAEKTADKRNIIEKGTDIKVALERISFEKDYVYLYSEALSEYSIYHQYTYVTFTEGEDGYWSVTHTDDKPSDGVYLNIKSLDCVSLSYIPYIDSGVTKKSFDEDMEYHDIYDCYTELDNIKSGEISGPPTEAYMILRVYNGNYEVVGVNVGGMPIKEFVEKTESGELDYRRFVYNWEYDEYANIWDEELTEYVTQADEI